MPAESYVDGLRDGKRATRRLGRAILALANSQHGVVSRVQLVALGASATVINGWIASGHLIVIHRGVYAVGHGVLSVEARWMAGVLAGGEGAALSHGAGGDLWELTGLRRSLADVTVQRRRRSRPGICFREHPLPADEVTEHSGIPVTTVARTLLDLAAVVTRPRLEQAVSIAEARQLGDSPSLADLIVRYPARRGMAQLRAVLRDIRLERGISRSELELAFLEFLDRRRLPRPEVNAVVSLGTQQLEVDCLWRSAGLVVELDSRAHHGDWEAAERDRARDLSLAAAGYRTARVTWRRLHSDADGLEGVLRAILAAAATHGEHPSPAKRGGHPSPAKRRVVR
ncbi:MAG: type IV toxin-antitoxin system AbiEi family antitoxin domain-containing protein [Solirubrobacterales bacterium]